METIDDEHLIRILPVLQTVTESILAVLIDNNTTRIQYLCVWDFDWITIWQGRASLLLLFAALPFVPLPKDDL
ncbi:hypothetical protein [Thiohalophilus sp.]|uniref:hypothetical protein n=1 Tax=Thiohalophilus sp. TaxID=3028392 RepID=UPI003975E9EB